ITLGEGVLMGSDDPTGDDGPKLGVAVTYTAPTPEDARKVFDELFGDGEVMMPFEATFFSKGFGAVADRFGVAWMVDTAGGRLTHPLPRTCRTLSFLAPFPAASVRK